MSSPVAGRTALLAVVLLLAGVTAGLAGSASGPAADTGDSRTLQASLGQANGTTNYLQVPDEDLQRTGLYRASVDVTAATRIDGDRLALEHAFESFRTRFERADTEAERTAAVRELTETLDDHTATLRQRQERAIDRYNAGDLGPNEFIVVLTRVDATAEEVQDTAGSVITLDETTLDYTLPPEYETQLRNYEADVLTSRGLIREVEFRPAIAGSGPSRLVYVETGSESVVVTTIVNDRYVREGFDTRALDPDGTPQLRTFLDALNRAEVLYPWAMAPSSQKQPPRVETLRNASIFSVDVSHVQGELSLYLDASTTDVFKEQQIRDLTTVTPPRTYTNGSGEFELTVNATHDTGPLEVSIVRRTTGGGANASVSIDGTSVGTTGPDGRLWTLDTRGTTSVRVTTANNATFTIEVPPGEGSR
ncbi:DUF7096 domain-containing protein [Halapricum hydrolyticum]|uniref:Uncharacterized protein n=1 Tax=Halapricum hydrolyticum TaxID=2979991 RepID=A0AAE3IEB4_9EURY|nr:hypothetical protein [Halapricum hydrolyticum]MCU4717845.1 hypothetical protein [Halapricum hydrolyticum]MCU4727009.1 hypothetical protein [Halapricum hydrolyticum]